jgi:hypothetical protein
MNILRIARVLIVLALIVQILNFIIYERPRWVNAAYEGGNRGLTARAFYALSVNVAITFAIMVLAVVVEILGIPLHTGPPVHAGPSAF